MLIFNFKVTFGGKMGVVTMRTLNGLGYRLLPHKVTRVFIKHLIRPSKYSRSSKYPKGVLLPNLSIENYKTYTGYLFKYKKGVKKTLRRF